MKSSLSAVLRILSSWQSNSLPVKAVLLSDRLRDLEVVVQGTISVEGSTVTVSDTSGTELRFNLAEATTLDLTPSTDFPADLRDDAMPRIVYGLSCRLPDGIRAFLYEMWADDAQDFADIS